MKIEYIGGQNGALYLIGYKIPPTKPSPEASNVPLYVRRKAAELLSGIPYDVFGLESGAGVIMVPTGSHRKAAFKRFKRHISNFGD